LDSFSGWAMGEFARWNMTGSS